MYNEALLEILAKMGAKNVIYSCEDESKDEVISFEFEGKKVEISGQWCNNGTGGITSSVVDA